MHWWLNLGRLIGFISAMVGSYLWRQGLLRQLTQDHTTVLSESRQFLGRALGMDLSVRMGSGCSISIENGDRFLLCTDGLYDFVEESELFAALSSERSAEQVSADLCQLALCKGSDDNVSALIVDILSLPSESLDDYSERLTRLPFLPVLVPGMKVDGYLIEESCSQAVAAIYIWFVIQKQSFAGC